MSKNKYKNVTFNNKALDKVDNKSNTEDVVEKVMAKTKEELHFDPTLNAYVPYFNEITRKYELFTIAIDPKNNKMELFRKELPHDNMNRAIMEMQSMYASDYSKRLLSEKQKRKDT